MIQVRFFLLKFYKKSNGISAISEKTLRLTKSLDDYKTLYKLRSKHILALHYSGWKTELYTADRQTVKNGQFAEWHGRFSGRTE